MAHLRKPPYRRKNLPKIFYASRVIANFVPNFVAVATGPFEGKCNWRHSMAHPRKPFLGAKISQKSLTQAELLPILSKILFPWQRRSVGGKCDWRHSMAHPRKTPYMRKNRAKISYASQVIANFVPNFVAMATGLNRG